MTQGAPALFHAPAAPRELRASMRELSAARAVRGAARPRQGDPSRGVRVEARSLRGIVDRPGTTRRGPGRTGLPLFKPPAPDRRGGAGPRGRTPRGAMFGHGARDALGPAVAEAPPETRKLKPELKVPPIEYCAPLRLKR